MLQKATLRIDQGLVDKLKEKWYNPRIWVESAIKKFIAWESQPAQSDLPNQGFTWSLNSDQSSSDIQAPAPAVLSEPTKEFVQSLISLIAHDFKLRAEVLGSAGLDIDGRIKTQGHNYLHTILPNYIDWMSNNQTFPREKFVEFVTKEQVRQAEEDSDE